MKKLISLIALVLLAGCLFAQNATENNVNTDVEELQKANASLKWQLKVQKKMLLEQIAKTDSISEIVQFTTEDQQITLEKQQTVISKQQSDISSTQSAITEQQSIISDFGQVFFERRTYAILAVIGSILLIALAGYLLRKKLLVIDHEIELEEEHLNTEVSHINEVINDEMNKIEAQFKKMSDDNTSAFEKETKALQELSIKTDENINKISNDIKSTVSTQIESVKQLSNEQLQQSMVEMFAKITEMERSVEKQIAAIKSDFSSKITAINKKLKEKKVDKA